ncbi:PUA-like domain-containing protein [Armillaria borealis]|uniref:PUA-like domain-containing protein n=1 Tax=Armillaria borealis TaxID=47425 RepID=A0AA39IX93_9AGAR|nr:PUA-like domain-containing protein [Armillaria borealis]
MSTIPHGGVLKHLVARDNEISHQLRAEAETLPDIVLTERQLCDLELIANGGFSPLEGFMTEKDYTSVVDTLRLADGVLFPIPITLDVSGKEISRLSIVSGSRVALHDPQDEAALAIITVEDIYKPDCAKEAVKVLGADDPAHPAVSYLRRCVQEGQGNSASEVIGFDPQIGHDVVRLRCLHSLPAHTRRWCPVVYS